MSLRRQSSTFDEQFLGEWEANSQGKGMEKQS